MNPIAVIDFETTGITPSSHCRATEIGIAILERGRIVDRYQSLMNAEIPVPPFIQSLTGITTAMLRKAPPISQVMSEAADFIGDLPLLAHNAAFDQKFWDAELAHIGRARRQPFACSLLLARRLLPDAPNHKLGTLNQWAQLPSTGKAHRAMADAEMAANLTLYMADYLREQHGINPVSHALFCTLQKVPAAKIPATLRQMAAKPVREV